MLPVINKLRNAITSIQLENKNLKAENSNLKSGVAFKRLRSMYQRLLDEKDRENKKLKSQLAELRAEIGRVIKMWMQANEDVLAEAKAMVEGIQKKLDKESEKRWEAERRYDEVLAQLKEERKRRCEAESALYDEEEKNKALAAQLHKDYTNSSKPSSSDPNHGKLPNGRKPSGKKPGAQPGHPQHGRKPLEPTSRVQIPPPEKFTNGDGRYRPTGRTITRQVINVYMMTEVVQYETEEYVCVATGKTVHAPFPPGVDNDVNIGETVKALAFMLVNQCNVSIGKTKSFLKDVSHNAIDLSTGFICGLTQELSEKTQEERAEIFNQLLASPTMHADFTFGRVGGKNAAVLICANGEACLFQGREKKGHEGIKGSPVELYDDGILITDHDFAFMRYGSGGHQECMLHVKRHLRGSIQNEPDLQWNKQMMDWISKAVRYWSEVWRGNIELNEAEVSELESEFNRILALAKSEYEYVPAGDGYRDGYNLYKRMEKTPQDYLLFLHNPLVVPYNNLVERLARLVKRKFHQVMAFRSMNGLIYFCDSLTVLETLKKQGKNIYDGLGELFRRSGPKPIALLVDPDSGEYQLVHPREVLNLKSYPVQETENNKDPEMSKGAA